MGTATIWVAFGEDRHTRYRSADLRRLYGGLVLHRHLTAGVRRSRYQPCPLLPTITATATTSQDGDGLLTIAFQAGSPSAPIDLTGIAFALSWHPVTTSGAANTVVTALSAGSYLTNGGTSGILTFDIPQVRLRVLPTGTYVASLVASYNGAVVDLGLVTITHSALGSSGIGSLTTTARNAATATSVGYVPGPQGLSAYQVAVANGYTGTQAQWLASLIGPQGAVGATGVAGATLTDLGSATGTLSAARLPTFTGDIACQAGTVQCTITSIGGNLIGASALLTALGAVSKAGDTLLGNLALPSLSMTGGALNIVNLYSNLPPNYFGASGAGPVFSMGCLPNIGCPLLNGLPYDSLRAQVFVNTTTQADAAQQEYNTYLNMYAVTGKAPFWTASTAYAAGAEVSNTGSNPTTYSYKNNGAACTSGTGAGPSGTGVSPADGTCASWLFIGENTNGKTTLGISIYSGPGSGNAWGAAINAIRAAGGDMGRLTTGLEIDTSILDGDHPIGSAFGDAYNLMQGGSSAVGSIGTIAHQISTSNPAGQYMWHCGVCIVGDSVAKDIGFGNGSSSINGIVDNAKAHPGGAAFAAQGGGLIAFAAEGTHSYAFDATGAKNSDGTINPHAVRMLPGQGVYLSADDAELQYVAAGNLLQFSAGGTVPFFSSINDGIFHALGGFATAGSGQFGAAVTTPTLNVENGTATCTHTPTTASETVSCSSDARLKRNIKEARSALAWLESYRIHEFETKSDGSHHTGVIAQELRVKHPDLVHELVKKDAKGNAIATVLAAEQPDPWRQIKAMQELYALVKLLLIWCLALTTALIAGFGFLLIHRGHRSSSAA